MKLIAQNPTTGVFEDVTGGAAADNALSTTSTNAIQNRVATTALNSKVSSADLADYVRTADLAAVATSGSYNDLTDKPSAPTNVSDLTNDAGYQTAAQVSAAISAGNYVTTNALTGKQDVLTEGEGISITTNAQTGVTTISATASSSASYDATLSINSENAPQTRAVYSAVQGKQDALTPGQYISMTVDNTTGKTTISAFGSDNPYGIKIVSWADGTDAQIVAMVQAADEGKIDLSNFWSVGDERDFALSAMSGYTQAGDFKAGATETHAAQTVTMVLMNEGYAGNKNVHFVVGMKDCLNELGNMNDQENSTHTNVGGWNICARRGWCNSIFYNAIASAIRSIFKSFKTTASIGNKSTEMAISTDYFAMFAEKEIFGAKTYSAETEANALSQIEYYETAANRIKRQSGTAKWYWLRSPYVSNATYFCRVHTGGSADFGSAGISYGLAPFGCI